MKYDLNERETNLILVGLYFLEHECFENKLSYGMEGELGGVPNPEEVHNLRNKLEILLNEE